LVFGLLEPKPQDVPMREESVFAHASSDVKRTRPTDDGVVDVKERSDAKARVVTFRRGAHAAMVPTAKGPLARILDT
jgi:hypothetical protein